MSQTVTHPSTNQTQSCLTSVIGLWMVTPCQLDIWDITRCEMKAIEILDQQFPTCQWANGQFCKVEAPLQPLANPPSCIPAIYANNKARIDFQCSLQIRNICSTTIPTPILSNPWVSTSTPESGSERITLICPSQAPTSNKVQRPIHVLHLPPTCSATSQHHLAIRITRWWLTYHSA